MQELKTAKSAIFLTLTYNDENIPIYNTITKQSIRVSGIDCKIISYDVENVQERISEVYKDDVQKFIKKLRKRNSQVCKDQIRYYLVNEYGEHTGRPHFHAIMFNIHNGLLSEIESIWGYGNIKIGDVNQSSIHYCTKYMLVPEGENKGFALMSRRPFLGDTYLTINQTKYHKYNNQSYVSHYEGQKISMPRVYKDRIFPKEIEENGEKKKIQNIYRQVAGKKALDKHKEELQKREKKYKEKNLDYNTLERLSDKNKYRKMVKQSKSKKV